MSAAGVPVVAAQERAPGGGASLPAWSRPALALGLLLAAAGLVGLLSLAVGAVPIPVGRVARILWEGRAAADLPAASREALIVLDIRLPRTLVGLAVGALLAVAGGLLQGLFRNPLADPGLAGVSPGAALAAAAAIVLGHELGTARPAVPFELLPAAAFAGALVATGLLYLIATREGRTSIATMLLAGIALAALAGAGTGALAFVSDDRQLRDLTFWTLGSVGGATWSKLAAIAPMLALVLLALPFLGRALNALVLGEAEALHLGIPVERMKRLVILVVALSVGAAVAVAGPIGFLGLVVPHVIRLTIGPDHRLLLPASALLGAALLVSADMAARTLVAPAELPIGIVTALVGAPYFLFLLLRRGTALDS